MRDGKEILAAKGPGKWSPGGDGETTVAHAVAVGANASTSPLYMFPVCQFTSLPNLPVCQFTSLSIYQFVMFPVGELTSFPESSLRVLVVAQAATKNKGKQAAAFAQELREKPHLCRFGLGVQTLSRRQIAMNHMTKSPLVKEMDKLVYGDAESVKAANEEQLGRVLTLEALQMCRNHLAVQEVEALHGEY